MSSNLLDDFLVVNDPEATRRLLERYEQQLRQLTEAVHSLTQRIEALSGRMEVDDARRQNALIRSQAPVPAFKTASEASQHQPPPLFSFRPTLFRRPQQQPQ